LNICRTRLAITSNIENELVIARRIDNQLGGTEYSFYLFQQKTANFSPGGRPLKPETLLSGGVGANFALLGDTPSRRQPVVTHRGLKVAERKQSFTVSTRSNRRS
jgi:hypothetical protein